MNFLNIFGATILLLVVACNGTREGSGISKKSKELYCVDVNTKPIKIENPVRFICKIALCVLPTTAEARVVKDAAAIDRERDSDVLECIIVDSVSGAVAGGALGAAFTGVAITIGNFLGYPINHNSSAYQRGMAAGSIVGSTAGAIGGYFIRKSLKSHGITL